MKSKTSTKLQLLGGKLRSIVCMSTIVVIGCAVQTEDDPVSEVSSEWSESTCATNAATEDQTFAVNPAACSIATYNSDSTDGTYGHDDCDYGWITEFTSTMNDQFYVQEPPWAGVTLNSGNCSLAYKGVYTWGYFFIGGWELASLSHYTGSWNGSACVWIRSSSGGSGPPYSTDNNLYGAMRTVNYAGIVFGAQQRAKGQVQSGEGPC
jgi:hypothetical protein